MGSERPSLAAVMVGNMLFNLRQPQRSCEREEIVECLEEVERAIERDRAAERDALERAEVYRKEVAKAAVKAAIPLEAITMSGTSEWHSTDVQESIREGIKAVRDMVMAQRSLPSKDGGGHV